MVESIEAIITRMSESTTTDAVMTSPTAELEGVDAPNIMVNLMHKVDVLALDLDKVWLKGGKLPLSTEGHLDIEGLHKQSPLTIPILHELNEFALRGVPPITITGKSATVELLADLQRKMFFEVISQLGMLEKPYVAQPNSSGVNFSSEVSIKPEFLEPNTGRMRAVDAYGKPTNKLVLLFFALDNGGKRDEYWPGGSHEVDRFPRSFYEAFLRADVQELLRESTRDSKIKRMQTIIPVFYNYPEEAKTLETVKDLSTLTDKQLWELAVVKSKDFSYASPDYGAKFNLELGMRKILESESLREKWTRLLQSLTGDSTEQITDAQSVRRTLQLLFPKDIANVTFNFVDEEDSGMGKRLVIDLNPPGVNKFSGFLKMVKTMEGIYAQAGLQAPNFFRRSIRLGDAPDKNDKELLESPGGWTNTDRPHEKSLGFPVDNLVMLDRFGIRVKDGETLEDTEHTYIFLRLIAFCRFGKLLDGIPEPLQKKLVIPQELQSL